VALGRKLFFDKRLSSDNSISCATCHDPNYGFADPHPVSIGVKGRLGERNSHTLLNVAFMAPLMWDGRADSLEEQSLLPFMSPSEFDLAPDQAALKLRRQGYSGEFKEVFGDDVTPANIAKALATYERTLSAGGSPFDRYLLEKDASAISPAARRGFEVFLEAKCDACHLIMTPGLHPFALKHVVFTDGKFHNLGVDAAKPNPDPGRFGVTFDASDWGRFRTPTLRNVALTAPYFHDGSAATLADVVDLYDKGGNPNRNLDPALRPLKLRPEQKQDLVRFLESLTSSDLARRTEQ
jgi:cytochrome c peroxidase